MKLKKRPVIGTLLAIALVAVLTAGTLFVYAQTNGNGEDEYCAGEYSVDVYDLYVPSGYRCCTMLDFVLNIREGYPPDENVIFITFHYIENLASFQGVDLEDFEEFFGVTPETVTLPVIMTIYYIERFARIWGASPECPTFGEFAIETFIQPEHLQAHCPPRQCDMTIFQRTNLSHDGPNAEYCEWGVDLVIEECSICLRRDTAFVDWQIRHHSWAVTTDTFIRHGNVHPGTCHLITRTTERCRRCFWARSHDSAPHSPFWCPDPNIIFICEDEDEY